MTGTDELVNALEAYCHAANGSWEGVAALMQMPGFGLGRGLGYGMGAMQGMMASQRLRVADAQGVVVADSSNPVSTETVNRSLLEQSIPIQVSGRVVGYLLTEGGMNKDELAECRLPVLSPGDRRNFARALWSPLLPEAVWESRRRISGGSAQVYLDVSGSMNAEMPLIVALLGHLSSWIRRPFWAFSTEVVTAVIERGVLKAGTSGGTSLECVLEHVEKTRPSCAVIVTDGYVRSDREAAGRGARPHAPARRRHARRQPGPLKAAGIPYSQRGRLPK